MDRHTADSLDRWLTTPPEDSQPPEPDEVYIEQVEEGFDLMMEALREEFCEIEFTTEDTDILKRAFVAGFNNGVTHMTNLHAGVYDEPADLPEGCVCVSISWHGSRPECQIADCPCSCPVCRPE